MKGLIKVVQLAQGAIYADRQGTAKYISNADLQKTEKTKNKMNIMEEQHNFDAINLLNSAPVDSLPRVNVAEIVKQVTETVMSFIQPHLQAPEETTTEKPGKKTSKKPAKKSSKTGTSGTLSDISSQ